ncbi:predicted protein [Arabidopsis lyrata subsp. lyrata]|uniref:Predicted protein n=1 Tax=Arabidopsis lyrata subsp. lyrata TaxID=81972 RepID=D7MVC7_ARALL|nr:predicted protein [Arabidopsis lyrata subsp. lyrata]
MYTDLEELEDANDDDDTNFVNEVHDIGYATRNNALMTLLRLEITVKCMKTLVAALQTAWVLLRAAVEENNHDMMVGQTGVSERLLAEIPCA